MFHRSGGYSQGGNKKMSAADTIRSIFEFALIILTVVALINERRIAAFEKKFFKACAIHIRSRRARKEREAQMLAEAAQPEVSESHEPTAEEINVESIFTVLTGGLSDVGIRVA